MNSRSRFFSKGNIFIKIRSKYILQRIFAHLQINKSLEIIKYNKIINKRLNKNINDYKKEYFKIEIELFPAENKYGKFINIQKGYESYFNIYFNDTKEEIKRTIIYEKENVKKLKIIIDYKMNYFFKLFNKCECIQKINFLKSKRNDINDTNFLFNECSSLKELYVPNLNTDNLEQMSFMFSGCSSLDKLDISNFNSKKVKKMNYLFYGYKSLKELNLSNFKTMNVIDMNSMF